MYLADLDGRERSCKVCGRSGKGGGWSGTKQSGVIGNKRWSCGRSVVVNTVGRSRAWSGKSGTAIVADLAREEGGNGR